MQILHWLFKKACEQERDCNTSTIPPTKKEGTNDKKAKGKDTIVLHKNYRANQRTKRTEGRKHGCNNLKVFAFICGKDIPKACFYRTLNFNRLRNLNRRKDFVNSVKMKREELYRGVENGITKKENSANHVGKKVLPVTEASLNTSIQRNDQCSTKGTNDDQNKGSKNKRFSRMKELLRWAASAKTEKKGKFNGQKVLQFRKHGTIKEVPLPCDEVRSESPNISFTWDVESNCSTISSVYSSSASLFENEQAKIAHSPPIHKILHQQNGQITSRTGNWITTDSEFVVLEL